MMRRGTKQTLRPFHNAELEWSDDSDVASGTDLFQASSVFHIGDFGVIAILLASIATHFYRISFPNVVCFDEAYFGRFTDHYIRREYFLDIHPPLGKLVLFAGAVLTRYNGSLEIGEDSLAREYLNNSYIALRMTNAVFSCLCPLLLYFTLRILGLSVFPSAVSSLVMVFEDSLIIEGRFILTDGILHCFVLLALFALSVDVRFPSSATLIFCGISVGFAISTKQTSWSLLAVILSAFFISRLQTSATITLRFLVPICVRFAVIVGISFAVFILSFTVHITILSRPGRDSLNVCPEMRPNRTEIWDNVCQRFGFWKQFFRLTQSMHSSNMGVRDDDDLGSRWWEWPLMTANPINFFSGRTGVLLLHIQPFNGFFCLVNLALFILVWFFVGLSQRNDVDADRVIIAKGLIFVIGFLSSLLPFALVPRILYLYHYLIPLIFLIGLVAFPLELLYARFSRLAIAIGISIILSSLASFWKYRYWTYGLPGASNDSLNVWSHWKL
jgi:dolichyl-phosphate-mannose--protein O-mannosyl transferase